jgi:hypothetical protein
MMINMFTQSQEKDGLNLLKRRRLLLKKRLLLLLVLQLMLMPKKQHQLMQVTHSLNNIDINKTLMIMIQILLQCTMTDGFTLSQENSREAQLLLDLSHQSFQKPQCQLTQLLFTKDISKILLIMIKILLLCMMTDGFILSQENSREAQLLLDLSHQSFQNLICQLIQLLFIKDISKIPSIMIRTLLPCMMTDGFTLSQESSREAQLLLDSSHQRFQNLICQLTQLLLFNITSITITNIMTLSIEIQLPQACMMINTFILSQEKDGLNLLKRRRNLLKKRLLLWLVLQLMLMPKKHQLMLIHLFNTNITIIIINMLETLTITIQLPLACTMTVMSTLTNQDQLTGNSLEDQKLSLMPLLLPRLLLSQLLLNTDIIIIDMVETKELIHSITIQILPQCMMINTSIPLQELSKLQLMPLQKERQVQRRIPLQLPTLRLLLCKNLQETHTITIQPPPACTMMVTSTLTNQEA